MALWRYEAVDRTGRKLRGVLDAPDPATVAQVMGARGYRDIQVHGTVSQAVPATEGIPSINPWVQSLPPETRALFFHQCATMMRAGFTPASALSDLGPRSTDRRLRAASARMASGCAHGGSLSDAIAAEGGLFPWGTAGLVAAGEAGGVLPMVLEEAAMAAELEMALNRRMGWVWFLIWQSVWSVLLFLPLMGSVDMRSLQSSVGNYVSSLTTWVLPIGFGLHAVDGFSRWLGRTPAGRPWSEWRGRRTPWTARLQNARARAAFTRLLRSLLSAGIAPGIAFFASAQAIPDSRFRGRLAYGVDLLAQGAGLDQAVEATGLFGREQIALLVTAQRTGTWPEALDAIATACQDEVQEAVEVVRRSVRRIGVLATLVSMGYVTVAGTAGSFRLAFQFADTLTGP